MTLHINEQIAGYYRFEAVRLNDCGEELSRRVAADWFPNLITDGGLDRYGTTNDWLGWCQVGSGSATPAFLDTALASRIAGTSNVAGAQTTGAQASSPYYTWRRKTFRFAAGLAAGNISEVGVGWSEVGNLFSRALVLDAQGNPTTITVLADEVLDVTYEFRCYAPASDTSGTITLDGANYDWLARAANVTSTDEFAGWLVPRSAALNPEGLATHLAFEGGIGAITSAPGGASVGGLGTSDAAYSIGSHSRQGTITCGLGYLFAFVAAYDAYLLGQKLQNGEAIGENENGVEFLNAIFKD